MQFKSFMEALKGKQHKIDKNKNGKIDAHDFKLLQKEESSLDEEDREDRADYKVSKSGRKSHKQIVFPNGEPTVDADKKDSVKEAKMSDADIAERERIVKGMKKNLTSFKSKYGSRAKDVMYATATKMAMKEEALDEISTAQMGHAGKTTIKHIKNPTVQQRMAAHDIKPGIAGYRDRIAALKDAQAHGNLKEEDLEEEFVNAREYASQGVMHPKHAGHEVHKVTGQTIDFYAHGTGDKVSGKVTKNDGKAVHIKDTKGKTHQFKVTPNLPKQQNESTGTDKSKKDDKSPPFDGPYSKPGKPGGSMNRARTLARQGMKQAMKEEFDLDITDEQADEIFEAVQKADIPAYLRKQKGDAPLKLSDLKRKDTLSDLENLRRNRGVKEQLELDEAVQSGNKGKGYHGQHESDVADKKYSAMHSKVKAVAGEAGHMRDVKKPNVMVKHYLDSVHGRHLAGNENPDYIKKDFGKFKKTYKSEMHEGVDFDQEGNLIAEKLSFGDFIAKMNEQLLEYEAKDGVYKHKGSYGGNYVDPEGADDADDKKKPAPAEKRGRGRPAGAKSGARKITGTSKLFK